MESQKSSLEVNLCNLENQLDAITDSHVSIPELTLHGLYLCACTLLLKDSSGVIRADLKDLLLQEQRLVVDSIAEDPLAAKFAHVKFEFSLQVWDIFTHHRLPLHFHAGSVADEERRVAS